MKSGLFTQIAMVAMSVGILITYVQPTFKEIGTVQNNIQVHSDELEKVAQVNSLLRSKKNAVESVSTEEKRKLLMYLPDEIDEIKVARDLYLISQTAGLLFDSVTLPEGDRGRARSQADDVALSDPHEFTLKVQGSYLQIKLLLDLLSKNEYPLEVHSLVMSTGLGGLMEAELTLVTYTYRSQDVTDPTN